MPVFFDSDNDKKLSEIIKLLKDVPSTGTAKQEDPINKILEIVQDLQNKLNYQGILITKIVATLSKMFQDGEINKDTFNKLDEFLKPYYDNPYQDDKY